MTEIPDSVIREIFRTGSLALLADFASLKWKARLRSTKINSDADPVVDATRASTILRDDHKWDVAARHSFIVSHFLHIENTTSRRIAAGQNGGVKAAMADQQAVDAMRSRIKDSL